ncbi:lytic transglycosylase domain-containing protein [Aeromicrobium chenweiae]|uniref:Lytic murein transglycosylase n=1 Tax=Aeromicrobium chenweiae TaxID=2079793 RepID=A0A2S0WLL5_9ACTN|nr:lytic transglycosylase domain-containing protein [Aeromicrobium chenweiae]AWB92233.1 lytic murein transglycosylase [Aeromicrobium chenweiae]TGN31482.1 lytic murein transglycosylase [Aeromicrobium chenweiae]
MTSESNGDRSTNGLLLGLSAVLVVAAALIAVSALTTGSSSPEPPAQRAAPQAPSPTPTPTPTTTMAPVKPSNEPVRAEPAPVRTRSGVADVWVERTSARTGIGPVALEAYGAASLRLAQEQPACRLGWTTLAGIGRVESGHGTSHGSRLRTDGTTSRRILGPALDGTAGTARIPSDEDSARQHGDEQWDRAMGPMQFIPSTWATWRSDGNGDGAADPHNVYDAAYAAGRYLCSSGADLTTGTGWTRAVFSYNHSEAYVLSVLAGANRYAGS